MDRKILIVLLVGLLGVLFRTPTLAAEPIKVGIVGPMNFVTGQHMWYAAEYAAKEVNAAGGIKVGETRRPLKLVKVDDNSLVKIPDAAMAVEKAITVDKVDFLVGGWRSEAVLAQQEVHCDYKKIMLGVGCSSPMVNAKVAKNYERYKYWFRAHPPDAKFGAMGLLAYSMVTINGVKKELGIEKPKVALVAEKAVWAEPAIKFLQAKLSPVAEIVGVWRPSARATDVTAELTAIKAKDTQIIVTLIASPVGITFAKQWGELEIPAAVTGVNVLAMGKDFWKATGGKANYYLTGNALIRAPFTPKTVPWFDRFVKDHKDFPNYTAAAYDTVLILVEGIERAGSTDTNAVIKALESTDHQGLFSRVVFDKKHDMKWGPDYYQDPCTQWINGELKAITLPNWRKIPGSVPYTVPPNVVKYWKGKK
ncbi:ABC transporter substrate-binding protein [Thermodesulfobacteriota bacterium]